MYIHVCIYICVYVYNEIINASAQQEVAVIHIAYCDVLECVFWKYPPRILRMCSSKTPI